MPKLSSRNASQTEASPDDNSNKNQSFRLFKRDNFSKTEIKKNSKNEHTSAGRKSV